MALGGEDIKVNTLTSIDEFKVAIVMQKELNKLKKANSEPEPEPPKKPKILGIDMSRENAQTFANDVSLLMQENRLDERALDDERFKRDNQLITDSAVPGDTVILRNKDGRCC